MSMPFTPTVKYLMIANVAIWIVFQIILEGFLKLPFTPWMGLYPGKVTMEFFVWQPFTYMFLHSLDWTHIVFNMLMLWWLGAELEQRWGAKFFLTYYLVSGVGAALIYTAGIWIYSLATGNPQGLVIPVIGASGAIFGLMVAYGILFGEKITYFMMIFPMKAKYFVMLLGGIQVVSLMTSGVVGGGVAYLAHLGGLVAGFLFLWGRTLWQKNNWDRKSKKRGRNLRLVVDNEPKKSDNENPKYWN